MTFLSQKLTSLLGLAALSISLFSCPGGQNVEPDDLSNDLIGNYHSEDSSDYFGPTLTNDIYDVEITRSKKNEINLKIVRQLQVRRRLNEPFKNFRDKEVRYFEDGKVTETKRFVVNETRSTDWYDSYTTKTEIYIEGKLTGETLALSASYKYPAYNEDDIITVNLEKK
ncbi:hypothetical protein [Dyadobacter aurulentus]|uniref:hypothetical protein n=1 Tax=Dyadobacter sp. UC 10 TaxID=2605428 RepID=UPI0011F3543F|nr:hypothetical protein [Dyadobacter sp. UC 10]KAA0990465.1 hypothetical protein FXO21_10015 [Dyadobacter sp. UC 10]